MKIGLDVRFDTKINKYNIKQNKIRGLDVEWTDSVRWSDVLHVAKDILM